MSHPGYTANSDVNKLVRRIENIQAKTDRLNGWLINRALDYLREGNESKARDVLHKLRDNLFYTEEETDATS